MSEQQTKTTAGNQLIKVNKRNTVTRTETCLKLTIKRPHQHVFIFNFIFNLRYSGVFIFNFILKCTYSDVFVVNVDVKNAKIRTFYWKKKEQ